MWPRIPRLLLLSTCAVPFVFGLLLAQSQSKDSKEEAAKLQPGTYYWSDDAWHRMEQINMSGAGGKHTAKLLVPGLTPQIVLTYRGARAPVQIKEDKPLFCVKFIEVPPGTLYAPSPRDIVVARFDEKKDHRELQITSGGSMITFKAGLGKDRLTDVALNTIDDSTVLLSPAAALRQGEYIISTTSMGFSGFDFGFHPAKEK